MDVSKCVFLVGLCVAVQILQAVASFGFGGGDRVLLTDVSVLSLYHNKMTTGSRSSPVAQLSCTGGSAGCSAFRPQVVQCYNRGSNGYDVQWECKTDMDNAYRFGQIQVSCEGYDSPNDDYILKGSCGLEYTLDLTKEGMNQGSRGQHNYYGNDGGHHDNSYGYKKGSSKFGDWITLIIVGLIIYGIYKTCIAQNNQRPDHPDDGTSPRRTGGYGAGGNPPPYGFRPGYDGSDSCAGQAHGNQGGFGQARGGGGGFWSGAATGGMLGYLFGSRGNQGYRNRPYGNSGIFGGGGGYGGGGFGGGGFSGRSSSSGTRTASGFGGTRRR